MKAVAGISVLLFALAAGVAWAAGPAPGAPPKLVQPAGPDEKFMDLTVGNVKVLYTEGWTEPARKLAEKTDALLRDGLAKIGIQQPKSSIEITLRPVVPDDLALCMPQEKPDLAAKSVHYPVPVPEGGAEAFTLDDMHIKQYIQAMLNYAFLFDVIASNADSVNSNPRWFLFGLSTYLSAGAAKELAGADAEKLLQTQWGDKSLEHYKDQLLKWTDKRPSASDQAYVLGCTQIFIEIEKKFGADAVRKIAAAYAASPKADIDSVVKIISDVIGQDFVEFLKSYESPKHPVLGVIADPAFAGPGVKVLDLQQGTCAENAGFAAGDVILKVNGEDLKDAAALSALVDKGKVGDALKMAVKRGDADVEVNVTLGEPNIVFPPAPGAAAAQGPQQPPQQMAPPTPEEILEIFKSSLRQNGFTAEQVDLMFKYIEHTEPGKPQAIDVATAGKMIEYLKMKGFTALQAQLLIVVFKIDAEGVKKAVDEMENVNKANQNENLTPEEMLVNLGWDKAMAQLQCMMMRTHGMTDEQIKADIRAGKIQKPSMGAPPGMPPGGMPQLPPQQGNP